MDDKVIGFETLNEVDTDLRNWLIDSPDVLQVKPLREVTQINDALPELLVQYDTNWAASLLY